MAPPADTSARTASFCKRAAAARTGWVAAAAEHNWDRASLAPVQAVSTIRECLVADKAAGTPSVVVASGAELALLEPWAAVGTVVSRAEP